jgi:hypothetical protein
MFETIRKMLHMGNQGVLFDLVRLFLRFRWGITSMKSPGNFA